MKNPIDLKMSRRTFMSLMGTGVITSSLASTGLDDPSHNDRPNILFIAVDDLIPRLGCYDDKEILTPHIDRLAARGMVFERAYCNVPVCGPSRASVLTGVRTTPNQWKCSDIDEDYITLPAYFKKLGYHTVSNGKVLHHMHDRADDWSEPPWRSAEIYHGEKDWANYNEYGIWQNGESGEHIHAKSKRGPYCEPADVPDNAYQDGKVADKTIADLKRLAGREEPFFLACGFWRPHLPFNAPKKYWDLYDREAIELAANRFRPEGLPQPCQSSKEIDRYARAGDRKPSDEFHREARHAYYACVSYVDAQVGKIVDALDRFGLADDTIIVLWGDHGWNLGEHDFWGKHNTLHNSLHSPLIVCAPKMPKDNRTDRLVEFVDIYPSLCQLAGVPIPDHAQGRSFAPLMKNPKKPWKQAVFSRWHGCEAVKTDRYLYTEWRKDGEVAHSMLFDHVADPDENVNIAGRPEASDVVSMHQRLLNEHRNRKKACDVKPR